MTDPIDGIPPGNRPIPPPPSQRTGDDKKPDKNEKPKIPVGQETVIISDEALAKSKESSKQDENSEAEVQSKYSDQEIEITVKVKIPSMPPKYINNYQKNVTQISDSTVIQTINTNLPKLSDELSKIRVVMAEQATEPDHYRAIADVAEAEKAAKSGDALKTLEYMKKFGKEAAGIAKDISVNLTAEFLKKLLMP